MPRNRRPVDAIEGGPTALPGVLQLPRWVDTASWGIPGVSIDTLRPLLDQVQHRAMRDALAELDRVTAHRARLNGDRPTPRGDIEAAYRTEQVAAAREHRPPAMSWSAVQQAEAAEQDHAAAVHAADLAIGACRRAVGALVKPTDEAGRPIASPIVGDLLHVVAVERRRLLDAGHDPAAPGQPLGKLYGAIVWPDAAYYPTVVGPLGNLRARMWWPLALAPDHAWRTYPNERRDWQAWAWARLAQRKARGFHIDAAGVLHFADAWRAPSAVRPRGYETGDLVMVGTGPRGEQGVQAEDLRASRTITAR